MRHNMYSNCIACMPQEPVEMIGPNCGMRMHPDHRIVCHDVVYKRSHMHALASISDMGQQSQHVSLTPTRSIDMLANASHKLSGSSFVHKIQRHLQNNMQSMGVFWDTRLG